MGCVTEWDIGIQVLISFYSAKAVIFPGQEVREQRNGRKMLFEEMGCRLEGLWNEWIGLLNGEGKKYGCRSKEEFKSNLNIKS